MLSKIVVTAMVASTVHGRGIRARVRNEVPHVRSDDLNREPRVYAQSCSTAVERLKKGPVDIDPIVELSEYEASQGNTLKYFDKSFYGWEAVFNT